MSLVMVLLQERDIMVHNDINTKLIKWLLFFNRPGVAGAVLQTLLRECSPPTTSHMSCVTCHMSQNKSFFFKVVELVGGGSFIK